MFNLKKLVFNLVIITGLSVFSINSFAYEWLNVFPTKSCTTDNTTAIKDAINIVNTANPNYFKYIFNSAVRTGAAKNLEVTVHFGPFTSWTKSGILPVKINGDRTGFDDKDCVGASYNGDVYVNTDNVKTTSLAKYVIVHELCHIAGVQNDQNTGDNYMNVFIRTASSSFTDNTKYELKLGRVSSSSKGKQATPLYEANHGMKKI